MLKRLLFLMVLGGLWATGCAGIGSQGASAQSALAATSVEDLDATSAPVYLMLVGEIAGQRGQFDVALDHYARLSEMVKDVRIAERSTQIALYVKDADKALKSAEVWSELDHKSLPAHRIAAILEIKAGNLDGASRELQKLFELKDPDLENTLIEMVKWIDAELPRDEGLKVMDDLTARHPQVAELHFAYALLASDKGALMVAQSELAKALAMRPGWSRALMLKAQLQLQAGDTRDARLNLEKAIKSDPGNTRAGLLYGQFLAKTGDLKGAERALSKVLERDAHLSDARFALASVWLELGASDRAKKEFEGLLQDPHWQPQSEFSLGLIEARLGHPEAALKHFDRVHSGGGLEFDARFNAASSLMSLGRLSEARGRLAAARRDYPDEKIKLYVVEAELLVKAKETALAYDLLSEALKEAPQQTDLLYSRALLADQLGHFDVMEADLRVVLDKNPDDAAALNALGFSLVEHRPERLEEAGDLIHRALDKRHDDPAILDSLGWLLFKKNQPKEALVYLRKAYKLYPDPEIAAHLGEVLWVQGLRSEGQRVWAEGLKKNPDQDDMRRVRESYPKAFKGGSL